MQLAQDVFEFFLKFSLGWRSLKNNFNLFPAKGLPIDE